jgi:hypothetical protein
MAMAGVRCLPRRLLALFALALALFAALPCAALASDSSCCGAAARCADAGESPCAQLAAAPCCGAAQAPVDASPAPQLPGAAAIWLAPGLECGTPARAIGASPRTRPAALSDHLAIREVLLRL